MTDLSDFGAGALPEKQTDAVAHESRGDRARHRRRQYRIGRCRAISTPKGCRCGGGIIDDADGPFCHYHGLDDDPVTIDSAPDPLARWCGTRPTTLEEIPEPCRAALQEVEFDD